MRALQIIERIVRRILSGGAGLLILAVVGLGLAAHLTVSGYSLSLLRGATTQLGKLAAGQRTEELTLDAAVLPETHRLRAHARLKLRSLRNQQRQFYFLLNDGLAIHHANVVGSAIPPSVYQLSMVTVVDIGRPLSAGETIELELDYDGQPNLGGVGMGAGMMDARDVLLNVDDFWYPNDVQSFFNADVTVSLPARMTLVHNGREIERSRRGDRQRVHWRSDRPLAGMSLVAGSYRRSAATLDNLPLQLYLADDVELDSDRVLHDMADANRMLTQRFGGSGFPQLTAFVNRRLRRAFNDGAGLMGLSLRYFRRGEYGFATVAHEVAHNWWGSTVAEKWLQPGTGGEWIVEGLAEFSSLLATEDRWGRDALTRRLQQEFFDPARQGTIADMSVLDNAAGGPSARETIYNKGAYVAMMLRTAIGDEALQKALRQFIERYRYSQATDRDLEAVVSQSSGQDVAGFFNDWVRSNKLADLTLDPSGPGQVNVHNRGPAELPGSVPLWLFAGGKPTERRNVRVGETVALPSGAPVGYLDPQLSWADMLRFNNREPRQPQPRFVIVNTRGDRLVTNGEPYPWAPTTLAYRTIDGKPVHIWELDRGLTEPPAWSADGARVLASLSEAPRDNAFCRYLGLCDPAEVGSLPAIVSFNAIDGGRTTIGYGASPAFGSNSQVFATRGNALVRYDPKGPRVLLRQRGRTVESPLPAPSGEWVAYVAARGNDFDLRLCDGNGGRDRSLLSWDRDRFLARWAPDSSRLYAVIGGNWDWQVWEIPLDDSPVRALVQEAADIRDLAVSPDGRQLAIVAAPALTEPLLAHRVYVIDLASGHARALAADDGDAWQVAWEKPDTLLAVFGSNETPLVIPERRTLRRIRLGDGSSEEVTTGP